MTIHRIASVRALVVSAALGAGMIAAPGAAQAGFFEQLFGGGLGAPAQAPAPVEAPAAAPAPVYGNSYVRHATSSNVLRRHKKTVTVMQDKKPVLQKTTDIMHDATLRPGDAVMMKAGIEVYSGPEADRHNSRQFLPLDDARHVTKSNRSELVAMDMTRRDPLEFVSKKDGVVVEGRSVGSDNPVVPGYKITDARGRSLRYVGP